MKMAKTKPAQLKDYLGLLVSSAIFIPVFVASASEGPSQAPGSTQGLIPYSDLQKAIESITEPPTASQRVSRGREGVLLACNLSGQCVSINVEKVQFKKNYTRFYSKDAKRWVSTTMEVWLEEGLTPQPLPEPPATAPGLIPDSSNKTY